MFQLLTRIHVTQAFASRAQTDTPKRYTCAGATVLHRNHPRPITPAAVRFEIIEQTKTSGHSLSCRVVRHGAISHLYKAVGTQPPKPRASWSHPLQSLFIFLLLLLFHPQRESLFHSYLLSQPPPLPATPRARRRCPCPLSPLLTCPYPVCRHIPSNHIMSAPAETEAKPVEPVAPVVESSSLIPAETAPPVEELKKEVRVITLPQSVRPLTRAFALSGGSKAHCEFPFGCFIRSPDFFP